MTTKHKPGVLSPGIPDGDKPIKPHRIDDLPGQQMICPELDNEPEPVENRSPAQGMLFQIK